ncbi:MAG: GYD domain-containing protein [Paracoccaceae bacterium]
MARYIITGNFTADAFKGMLAHPSDRQKAVAPLIEAAGGRLEQYLVTTGRNDFLMIVTADDPQGLLASLLAAGASGAVSNLRTVQAFTSAEFLAAQQRGGNLAPRYQSPT